MTISTKSSRKRAFCKKDYICQERLEYLLKEDIKNSKDIQEIKFSQVEQPVYDLTEEKTKRWIRRYKKYIKGEKDYSFYEHNLIIPDKIVRLINNRYGWKQRINSDDEINFHLKKHSDNIATEKILQICQNYNKRD